MSDARAEHLIVKMPFDSLRSLRTFDSATAFALAESNGGGGNPFLTPSNDGLVLHKALYRKYLT
jgi:hypothetical protein